MTLLIAVIALFNVTWFAVAKVSAQESDGRHRGKTAAFWHLRYVDEHRALTRHGNMVRRAHRIVRKLRRSLVHSPSSLEAIRLAAITYRQSYGDMVRVADCESPGLYATLVNDTPVWNGEHATGLFQFLPSTFASTPYHSENIKSRYANALAAGWMWANGRRGEWACR